MTITITIVGVGRFGTIYSVQLLMNYIMFIIAFIIIIIIVKSEKDRERRESKFVVVEWLF